MCFVWWLKQVATQPACQNRAPASEGSAGALRAKGTRSWPGHCPVMVSAPGGQSWNWAPLFVYVLEVFRVGRTDATPEGGAAAWNFPVEGRSGCSCVHCHTPCAGCALQTVLLRWQRPQSSSDCGHCARRCSYPVCVSGRAWVCTSPVCMSVTVRTV